MGQDRLDFETGVTLLDEQHKQLFHLASQAHNLLKDENTLYKFDDLKEILNGLREYSLHHFTDEEAYMESIHYAKLEEHKKLHSGFVEKLDEVFSEAERISLGNQDSILHELWGYLTVWMKNHICVIDKKMIEEGLSSH